jgi:3-oxoacyl-[acyl-carrier protein] reductase
MTTLSGKTALVTGASRGIGRAAAIALAKGGAQVLVHYSQGKAEAEAVVAESRMSDFNASRPETRPARVHPMRSLTLSA